MPIPPHQSETSPHFVRLFGVMLAVAALFHWAYLPYLEDDAFIHMRVGRNWTNFGTPFFNAGEAVNSSTSPAWIAVAALLSLFGGLQPAATLILNAILSALAATVWGLVWSRLVPESEKGLTGVTGAAFVVLATVMPASIGGMETPLAVLSVGLSFFLLTSGNPFWSFFACLAPLVRPECVVFVPALLLARAKGRRLSLWEPLLGLVAAVPFIWIELSYFGSILPHTAHAKALVYQLSPSDFIRQLSAASYGMFITKKIVPVVVFAIVLLACWVIFRSSGAVSQRTRSRVRAFCYIVLPALAILGAYAANRVFVFPWYSPLYLVPIHLAFFTVVVCGVRPLAWLSLAALIPLAAQSFLFAGGIFDKSFSPNLEAAARARQLLHVGSVLEEAYPEAVLLAPEIGAIGFSFPGKILDAVGLVSPEALKFHPMRVPEQRAHGMLGAVPARFVSETKPSLVVGLDIFMQELLESEVSNRYRRFDLPPALPEDLARLDGKAVFGSSNLVLLVREDLPDPPRSLISNEPPLPPQ